MQQRCRCNCNFAAVLGKSSNKHGFGHGSLGTHLCHWKLHTHILKNFANSAHQVDQVVGKKPSNRSYAEAVRFGQLSWVDDHTTLIEPCIEKAKVKIRVVWKQECGDDSALLVLTEVRMETQFCHTSLQHLKVCRVPCQTSFSSALSIMFQKCLLKSYERMSRRREAKLPIVLQSTPLLQQVERQAPCVNPITQQSVTVTDRKTKTRTALQILVGGRHKVVYVAGLHVHRVSSKARHGVNNVANLGVEIQNCPTYGLDRVEGSRSRLMVNDPDMCVTSPFVSLKLCYHIFCCRGFCFIKMHKFMIDPVSLAHLGHTQTVCTIGHYKDPASFGRWRNN
mmetsp:Transcript_108651/g.215758  ORF Transcript_108651/g.215758 Transcript_108651/m.215758 type:complete len:337 (-) Transcript_108651:384-1394(-)